MYDDLIDVLEDEVNMYDDLIDVLEDVQVLCTILNKRLFCLHVYLCFA